jgi:hypothetical protein
MYPDQAYRINDPKAIIGLYKSSSKDFNKYRMCTQFTSIVVLGPDPVDLLLIDFLDPDPSYL